MVGAKAGSPQALTHMRRELAFVLDHENAHGRTHRQTDLRPSASTWGRTLCRSCAKCLAVAECLRWDWLCLCVLMANAVEPHSVRQVHDSWFDGPGMFHRA